jgi:dual specificity protein kinase YAK1
MIDYFLKIEASRMSVQMRNVFTTPSVPAANGFDNVNGDLIVSLNDHIVDPKGPIYAVAGHLGCGHFGQVFRVVDLTATDPLSATFAMKISRSEVRLIRQAMHEVAILQHLVAPPEPESCRISKIVNHFVYQNHVCIILELLSLDLLAILTSRENIGIPLPLLQTVTRELLEALVLCAKRGVVHGDIKPENIVLCGGMSTDIKLIDFGSARTLEQRCSVYVQSRYYRAPEVVLRLPHGHPIDIWSLGCVICEMFIAEPIFAGQSEIQLLEIIVGFLGQLPIAMSSHSPRFVEFFQADGTLKSEEQVCREKGIEPKIRHHYLATETSLYDLIVGYEMGMGRTGAERKIQRKRRLLLFDLVSKMLTYEPERRITAMQALQHPFVTADFGS